MHILWIVFIGFVAGMLARWFSPAPNNPSGFILTVVLGIAGAFVATFIGQKIGWYREDQGAGLIGATVGAIAVLTLLPVAQSNAARAPVASQPVSIMSEIYRDKIKTNATDWPAPANRSQYLSASLADLWAKVDAKPPSNGETGAIDFDLTVLHLTVNAMTGSM